MRKYVSVDCLLPPAGLRARESSADDANENRVPIVADLVILPGRATAVTLAGVLGELIFAQRIIAKESVKVESLFVVSFFEASAWKQVR